VVRPFVVVRIGVFLCFIFSGSLCAQESGFGQDFDSIFSAPLEAPMSLENEEKFGVWSKVKLNGYFKNETAYRVREPRSITKIRNIAYLDAEYPYNNFLDIKFSGWTYYDLAYDLFNYETIAARLERNSEEPIAFVENLAQEKDSPVAAIRELYLDMALETMDIRLGKQYITWGVLEGVRIVDEVNPMDFRELILPDLIDYRIPLWSGKLDYYTDLGSLQLIVIPDLKFNKPAPPGSEWELLQEVPGTREPESWTLENTEIGMKLDTTLLDTELSFSYFYTWDDFPVVFRTVKITAGATEDPVFYPTYTRMSMYGMTLVRPVGDYILKSELAYVENKFFGRSFTADDNNDGYVDTNGVVQKNHVRWGVGIDLVAMKWDVSAAMTQWIILDYEDNLIQEKFDTSYNVFVRREFSEYSMTVQGLWIYLQQINEIYLKPKLSFQITNNIQIAVGLDLFSGAKSDFGLSSVTGQGEFNAEIQRAQFVGNFNNNDRVFFEFKYSF